MSEFQARARAILFCTLAIGLGLRVAHFLARPSLAMDEARLALNIAGRTFAGLTGALDLDQSAPLLFLWAERLATRILGVNELALRVLPLLAGAGVLLLSWALMRRVVGLRSAVLGLAILAVAPTMVVYSNEVKQYMVEALVALALVRLGLEWLDAPSLRMALLLALGGVLAVWASGSAVLVLAGITPALFLARTPRRPVPWRPVLLVCLAWGISFGLAYHLTYRAASLNPYLARYWASAFLTAGNDFVIHSWLVLQDVVWGFMAGYGGLPRKPEADGYVVVSAIVGLACVLGGGWHLRRTRGIPVVMLIAGPLVATLIASAAGVYPLGQRLLLFAVPLIVTLGVAGLEAAASNLGQEWGRRIWWVAGSLVVLPLLAVSLWQTAGAVMQKSARIRLLLHTLDAHRRVGEGVYVFGRTLPAWGFYTTDWSRPDRVRLAFINRIGRSGGPAFENAPGRDGSVMPAEGNNLVYQSPRGEEIIGIPTGMEYVSGHGLLQRRPDPGWVAREAERIQRAARPGIWVVMTEFLGPEYEMLEELRRRGGRVTAGWVEPGHILARYEFAVSATSSR